MRRDFKLKLIITDKGHFIHIKGTINQKDITILKIYAPNSGAPNFIKERTIGIKDKD